MNQHILIVGTVPYNRMSTSRAFDAYFHYWDKECCAQIFSNAKIPCKGHCGTLYQITDHMILRRWFNKKVDTGVIFNYDELPLEWTDNSLELSSRTINLAYKLGAKHTPITHLARKILWRKKYWCTEKLNAWLDDFKPDCVFLSFSDDFFIPQIAYYVAQRYDIPIVSSIGDDYYFNEHFSLSPFYWIYKKLYKHLIRKVLAYKGSAIYISDKIRDKYNSEFNLDGETVYLTSDLKRRDFRNVNAESPLITYFGNIRMGRNISLNEIGLALGEMGINAKFEVYSNENDKRYYKILNGNPYITYCGAVPYSKVLKRMSESDITVIVEGFKKRDIDQSRYSLSTKAADALASGVSILTYGSQECGIVEYMQSTKASVVCTDRSKLKDCISKLIDDKELQKTMYDNALIVTEEHHNLVRSCSVFEGVVEKTIDTGEKHD